ncbi:MAG: hypothetical protein ACYS5V_13385 [Planctomycetota bacterium]|jgi:hypothetical protein
MATRLDGRPVTILVVLAVCGLASFVALAEPLKERSAIVGAVSREEKARIAALSDVNELVNLLKTGVRGQKSAAARALMRKGRVDILLATAKAGPSDSSNIIIEAYQPRATAKSDVKKRQEVDAYVAFLEEQLRSKSPVVRPLQALRSLGRMVRCEVGRHSSDPRLPRPAPRYGHKRVVNALIKGLKDKRAGASGTAAMWLGIVGAYDLGRAQLVSDALTAHRQATASAPAPTEDQQRYKKMRLGLLDRAIKNFNRERSRRIRSGVEGETGKAKAPSRQPASSKTGAGEKSPNR